MKARSLLLPATVIAAALLSGCAGTAETEADATAAAGAEPAATSGPDAAASASMSPAHPVDTGQTFVDMDTNRDGSLSRDEVTNNEMLTAHFSQADTDGNGSLSEAEVNAHRESMAGKPR